MTKEKTKYERDVEELDLIERQLKIVWLMVQICGAIGAVIKYETIISALQGALQ